ncbi:MAG: trigger factor [Chloroflexi bacterium]|nr:trigger factor [Chloroflexota bacterium]
MKITTEKLPRSQVLLNIEVEPEQMERSLERAYRRIANRTTIPGFRKGKAPRSLIERYLGRSALVEEALEQLIPQAYNEALEAEHIDAIAQPKIEVVQDEPPIFKATVPVRPTVELGDYRSLRFPRPQVEVTDQEVEEELEQLRQRSAPWEPVERPVQLDDLVTLDVQSTVEGRPFVNDKGISYPVVQGFAFPLPGFADQLVGAELGVPKEFTLTLPEDAAQADLAGKPVAFTVTVQEIKAKKLPELNDEFAKGVGEGYESLEALRAWLRDQLREDKERENRRELEDRVVQAVTDQATLEYPDVLVEHEVDHLLEDVIPPSISNNQARLEEYLHAIGKTREELREERRPNAAQRVERSLVLSKLAEQEQITVSDEEVAAEVVRIVSTAGAQAERMRELLSSQAGQESITRMLRTRKTLERLIDLTAAPDGTAAAEGAAAPEPEQDTAVQAEDGAAAPAAEEQPSGPATA